MISRRRIPVTRHCRIGVTTERMRNGKWAVVATVTHTTRTAEQTFDLPVPKARFASAPAAETYGVRMAQRWIDHNMPKTERGEAARARTKVTSRRPAARRARTHGPKRAR